VASATGVSGLTASFLPIQKTALSRGELYNDTTQQAGQTAETQVQRGLQAAASEVSDVSSTALQSRGSQINLLA
jgi:hypothetical protein